jgi:hypothetical protein|tara:strand:- start:1105 stop:1392 length:288 start_codon:yes stop_codon:yes gene_type:complete
MKFSDIEIGDLVKKTSEYSEYGFVVKIDRHFYGARQAYKIYKNVARGHCIRPSMADGIGPTKDGIRDRVMVLWPDAGYTYEESNKLKIISKKEKS